MVFFRFGVVRFFRGGSDGVVDGFFFGVVGFRFYGVVGEVLGYFVFVGCRVARYGCFMFVGRRKKTRKCENRRKKS